MLVWVLVLVSVVVLMLVVVLLLSRGMMGLVGARSRRWKTAEEGLG